MLEAFTIGTFAAHLGETFALRLDSATTLDLELIAATALSEATASGRPSQRRTPFSIVFRGPLQPILPQRIYRMEHAAIGTFELFLVPVGPGERGMRYEAIFT